MIYSIVPLETIFANEMSAAQTNNRIPETVEAVIDGVLMEVEPIGAYQAKIVRLLSPDPYVYLNSSLCPGSIIQYSPQLR